MSSDVLSRPVNVDDFGLIYAGAQKNIGLAGLTVIIVRKDLCGNARALRQRFWIMRYRRMQARCQYAANLRLVSGRAGVWVKVNGGLAGMAAQNQAKADLFYNAIDSSNFYSAPVASADRSVDECTLHTS